ncbi:P-loop containing nucleoside triphosphate hydrolase protein [Xylaria nigripes]|nr:P-loop containing nucleoside triphosphate hydrolase protein [Xylaria nigripes]
MDENGQCRPSGLRAPSKMPAEVSASVHGSHSTFGLQESTESQNNMRTQSTGTSGTKRNLSAQSIYPEAKRKPLGNGTDHHGKPASNLAKPVRGNSIKDLNQNRLGYQSTTNSNIGNRRQLPTATFSSNSNFGASVGPGAQPPSRSHTRTRSAAAKTARPATSIGTRDNREGNNVNDLDEKFIQMDSELQKVKEFMESTERSSASAKEELDFAKKRVITLEEERNELRSDRGRLKDQLEDAERLVRKIQYEMEEQQKKHEREYKFQEDDHKREVDLLNEQFKKELEKNEKLQQEFEARCGAEAEARLESLSQDNKDLRSSLERQKREHEHEIRLLNETLERRNAELHKAEHDLRTVSAEKSELKVQIDGNLETIQRLRRRAEDAEETLSKDQGYLGGQISSLSSLLDAKSENIQTLEENAKKLRAECELEIEKIKSAAEQKVIDETAVLKDRLIKEEERRHKLFEQVQELKGNIRVMCRIKPPSDSASDALIPFQPQMNDLDEEKIDGLKIPTVREDPTEPGRMLPGKPRDFNFERVFNEKCTNSDVFDEISQLVQSVMDGKKVCIFCYGQTGSGKTFTMSKRQGDGDDGVIPRTQGLVFSEVERLKTLGWEFTVEGGYLEVYQDKLYDLLASRHSKPEPLSVDPIGDELKIKGHSFTLLNEARDLEEMINTADANRHVAATAKNDRSSRSHSILVLKIVGIKRGENGEVVKTRRGTLNLIDLAGSEKPDKNGPQQVYKEGVEINSSLSYLRTVLSGLGQGKTEGVDFRSYTLTQLLRPSLGKGCRTLMFVMVSPLKENENETIRSLEFARDAQKVKMGGNSARPKK